MRYRIVLALLLGAGLVGCGSSGPDDDANTPASDDRMADAPDTPAVAALIGPEMAPGEVSLFDGSTLGSWAVTDFGGQGKVYVQDGQIIMEMGNDLTGITWSGPVVRMNYEISLDAMRVEGNDFFCGLTFPVRDSSVTFVVGGWGGGVCGISCVNYYDASENETSCYEEFHSGRWYHIRARITPDKIVCWIDGKTIVDLETAGKKLDVRLEVEESKPLGVACWRTKSALRNIQLVKLPDPPAGDLDESEM
ncbi:MAG: DUF1080 domain-containing protein [Sedimentisphaerales bacterium]|nr:DUF1080 domain-containing protein [Sedimentisphaerales bacterium]